MKHVKLMSELTLEEKESINGGCANVLPNESGGDCTTIGIPDIIFRPGGIDRIIWGCGCS